MQVAWAGKPYCTCTVKPIHSCNSSLTFPAGCCASCSGPSTSIVSSAPATPSAPAACIVCVVPSTSPAAASPWVCAGPAACCLTVLPRGLSFLGTTCKHGSQKVLPHLAVHAGRQCRYNRQCRAGCMHAWLQLAVSIMRQPSPCRCAGRTHMQEGQACYTYSRLCLCLWRSSRLELLGLRCGCGCGCLRLRAAQCKHAHTHVHNTNPFEDNHASQQTRSAAQACRSQGCRHHSMHGGACKKASPSACSRPWLPPPPPAAQRVLQARPLQPCKKGRSAWSCNGRQ